MPDYLLAIECTDDQYFDDIVRQCGPCSELCDHSERTGTTDECKEKCPAYLDKRPAQDQAASHQIVNDLKAVQTDDHQNDDDASTSALPIHPAYIAVICIGVLLLILVPVTVVIGLRQCTRSYERAPQDDVERQGKGGNKPV
nr:hypothetical protein BaRGS_008623 [Batillaria attramentaria]